MRPVIRALSVDNQIDFVSPDSPMYVEGAQDDARRLSMFYRQMGPRIASHHLTFDEHQKLSISLPAWWVDSEGRRIEPMTPVLAEEMRAGVWDTAHPAVHSRTLDYLYKLEAAGKRHMVWHNHGVRGTPGACIDPELMAAVYEWSQASGVGVDFLGKGSNPYSEHFSIIKAEVADPLDPGTQTNWTLVDTMRDSDFILLSGQALSHCLGGSAEDLADAMGEEHVCKMVMLMDTTSSIPALAGGPDFPAQADALVARLRARGMHTTTTREFLANV